MLQILAALTTRQRRDKKHEKSKEEKADLTASNVMPLPQTSQTNELQQKRPKFEPYAYQKDNSSTPELEQRGEESSEQQKWLPIICAAAHFPPSLVSHVLLA